MHIVTNRYKILVLSRYDRLGASSRIRCFQYIPYLENAGIQVEIAPFFDAGYLEHLYATGRRRIRDVVPRYLKRFRAVIAARQYSAIWVEKEIFPFLPSVFETLLGRFRIPYLVDYDDATFHAYDQHPRTLVRKFLGNSLGSLIACAQCVTVGNSYLGDYARMFGAKRVELIPTVVNIMRYHAAEEPPLQEFRIGWIGSPTTTKYLYSVRGVLRRLSASRPVRLVTIGALPLPDFGVPLEQHTWSESTEARLLESIHVGIMPLPDTPWERGKCGYKLIQYLATARPVVGSPVGVNRDIITKSVGFQADGDDQWFAALQAFSDNAALRRDCGKAGRLLVEEKYSLQAVAPKLMGILESVMRAHA